MHPTVRRTGSSTAVLSARALAALTATSLVAATAFGLPNEPEPAALPPKDLLSVIEVDADRTLRAIEARRRARYIACISGVTSRANGQRAGIADCGTPPADVGVSLYNDHAVDPAQLGFGTTWTSR
jgi:hypothetical protein